MQCKNNNHRRTTKPSLRIRASRKNFPLVPFNFGVIWKNLRITKLGKISKGRDFFEKMFGYDFFFHEKFWVWIFRKKIFDGECFENIFGHDFFRENFWSCFFQENTHCFWNSEISTSLFISESFHKEQF